jgi:ABC-type enterobactin transport system permease subunit
MQMVITFMAVVAGLVFSVAVALLAEKFIFGQVFRLFVVRQANDPVAVKIDEQR